MNTIAFDISISALDDGSDYKAVDISIDGRKLLEILHEIELPLAKKEGSPNIAGAYAGLPAGTAPRAFLGEAQLEYGDNEDKVAILECTCGFSGCWPFAVRIDAKGDLITWSDFEQPHRDWSYSGLGVLKFDPTEYRRQLEKLPTQNDASKP